MHGYGGVVAVERRWTRFAAPCWRRDLVSPVDAVESVDARGSVCVGRRDAFLVVEEEHEHLLARKLFFRQRCVWDACWS